MDKLYRIIDANLNRSREGLRVCEDITRFILDNAELSARFKKLRHEITAARSRLPFDYIVLLESRDSIRDVGKKPAAFEAKRRNFEEIFIANIERAKEALRSLEEFTKPVKSAVSEEFQKIRFDCYGLEKRTLKRLRALCGAGQKIVRHTA